MKVIYHYTPNGMFCGQDIADESPLEPGVYLIPSYATDIEPPVIVENQECLFIDGCWKLQDIPEQIEPIQPQIPTPEEITAQTNYDIISQIQYLESQQTERRVREAVLGIDNGWLDNLNRQVAMLRTQLK